MKEKGDVLFLQETHTIDKNENAYRHMSKDTYIFAHGQSNSKGVMIIISEKIEHEVLEEHRDPNGRYIIAICLLQGYTFVLINVYAPNVERENAAFLSELNRKIEIAIREVSYDFIVAEGDWNFTENNYLDRKGGNPKPWVQSTTKMQEIKENYDVIDIYRTRNDEKRAYTYRSASKGTYSRIDRFYISDSLQSYIASVAIAPTILSDHSVVTMHVKCNNDAPKGPGFWRLNNDLLLNNDYVNDIKEIIKNTIDQKTDEQDWRALYDFLKFQVKQHSIKISKITAKKNRDEIKSLEDSIIFFRCAIARETRRH